VGGGEQLVAAVAAGSAASPPSPGPEPSPMDVDEMVAGVLPGWAASPPSPAPEWSPMDRCPVLRFAKDSRPIALLAHVRRRSPAASHRCH